jgi:transposase InsO family protein
MLPYNSWRYSFRRRRRRSERRRFCITRRGRCASVGDAYDNAMAESFFASLERELLSRRRFKSQAEAKMAVFEWIEGWYNPHRRHSALGYRSPVNYERDHAMDRAA